jgi:hypothetical protein
MKVPSFQPKAALSLLIGFLNGSLFGTENIDTNEPSYVDDDIHRTSSSNPVNIITAIIFIIVAIVFVIFTVTYTMAKCSGQEIVHFDDEPPAKETDTNNRNRNVFQKVPTSNPILTMHSAEQFTSLPLDDSIHSMSSHDI